MHIVNRFFTKVVKLLSPQPPDYFSTLTKQTETILGAVELFRKIMLEEDRSVPEWYQAIQQISSQGDIQVREVLTQLHSIFATPISRESLRELAQHLDDVVDELAEANIALLLWCHVRPTNIYPPTEKLLECVRAMCMELQQCIGGLAALSNHALQIRLGLDRLYALEMECNRIYHEARTGLYALDLQTAAELAETLKWHEVLRHLEHCGDFIERTCRTLESIIMRSA